MKLAKFFKQDSIFYIILFTLFIGFMFALYSNYLYYPSPLPNEYPQHFAAPPSQAPQK